MEAHISYFQLLAANLREGKIEAREANLKHLIGSLHKAVQVTRREPPAEGRRGLEKPPEQNQRLAPVDGGNLGDVVVRQRVGLGRAQLEQVPRLLREGVDRVAAGRRGRRSRRNGAAVGAPRAEEPGRSAGAEPAAAVGIGGAGDDEAEGRGGEVERHF